MGWGCSTKGGDDKCTGVLVGKLIGKKAQGRPKRILNNNFKKCCTETECNVEGTRSSVTTCSCLT
jgi:hypothetical protein